MVLFKKNNKNNKKNCSFSSPRSVKNSLSTDLEIFKGKTLNVINWSLLRLLSFS